MAVQIESNCVLFVYASEAVIPVDQMSMAFPMPSVSYSFEGNVAARAGERGGLLIRRMEESCSVKDEQRWVKSGKWMGTCMPGDVTVGVVGAIEEILRSVKWVKGGRGGRSMLVEVANGTENGTDDSDFLPFARTQSKKNPQVVSSKQR